MATLTHAFLHYAMKNATASNDPFTLYGKHFRLKSYGFAQPTPGNLEFAADFASITQAQDNALVINNDMDPVPKLPFTLQDLSNVAGDLPGNTPWIKAFRGAAGMGGRLWRAGVSMAEALVKDADSGLGAFLQ